MKAEATVNPMALPMGTEMVDFGTEHGVRKKRQLKEEDKTVYQLRKKFAALCEDSLDTVKCLNVEEVSEGKEGINFKFASQSTMSMEEDGSEGGRVPNQESSHIS